MTAAAVIRETAMRLFAERGVAAVSVRDIAVAAGVSPSLVIHHYKSKEGLKAAADERAIATLTDLLGELTEGQPLEAAAASLGAKFAAHLREQPVLPAYIRRMLVDGGPSGAVLFRSLFDASLAAVGEMEASGLLRPAPDAPARAVFLLVNDIIPLILREQIADVLGVDPLSVPGMARWSAAVADVYAEALFTPAARGEEA